MKPPRWMRRIFYAIFGHFCERHEKGFRSDFCGECMEERYQLASRIDSRPEWTRAEGAWPIRKEA
jgi:hypothetical protein